MRMLKITVVLSVIALTTAATATAGLFTVDIVNNPVDYDGPVAFEATTFSTSGTGVIGPFLAVGGASSPTVWGSNNDESSPESPFVDTSKTSSLTLAEVPIVNYGGTFCREFLLDNNQESGGLSKSLIQLTELEIYTVDNDPNINVLATLRATGTLAYSLDDATDDGTVDIDAQPPGSGKADMFLYVPDSFFTEFTDEATTNVYMYCEFQNNNDGFEEWAVRLPGTPGGGGDDPVPEPAALGLVGIALLAARKRRS
jgi:hypothetical protein